MDSFIGTGWAFPPTFIKGSQNVAMVSDEDDIRQSLQILLTTGIGERVMQSKYGCNMTRLLFEPVNTTLTTYMEDIVRTAILYFEPRIILDSLQLIPLAEEGRIDIKVEFTIAGTNSRYNYVYPFYKLEGTF